MATELQNAPATDSDFLITPSGAGRILGGITGAAVVALSNRGQLACRRSSSGHRLYAMRDLRELLRKRQARGRRPFRMIKGAYGPKS